MITDLQIYSEPPLTAMPVLGGKYTDPVFGSEIIRASDEADGLNCGTYYSYWPTFNSDNTRLLIRADAGAIVRNFDPVSFTTGPKDLIASIPGVGNPTFEGANWSTTDPNLLYLSANASIYAYHADTKQYELLVDIQSLIPDEYIKQPSWGADGNRVGFTRKRYADYSEPGYAVYDRLQDRLLLKVDDNMDEVTISQSGKYIVNKRAAQGAGQVEQVVTDLDTGAQTQIIDDADAGAGHGDAGQNIYVGYDNFANRIVLHDLSNPKPFKTLFQFQAWGLGVGHTSMRAVDETWALQSFFGTPAGTSLFSNEIIQIATDGSQNVRRLLHHRSIYRNYYDSPRANISRDGKLIAFTSNMGQFRTDLYVARLDIPSLPPIPPPSMPATKKVPWPKSEGRQNVILDEQWNLGFRLKRNLSGDFAEFEKCR